MRKRRSFAAKIPHVRRATTPEVNSMAETVKSGGVTSSCRPLSGMSTCVDDVTVLAGPKKAVSHVRE